MYTGLLARAGGGQSFDDSGGGGIGSSFHSGGGHFFFFGGGGSGGAGGDIGAAVVVILVVFVIFGVLRAGGRRRSRSGGSAGAGESAGAGTAASEAAPWAGDDRPAMQTISGSVFPGSHPDTLAGPETPDAGLAAIETHDPRFNREEFLELVQRSFFLVQEAWTKRQPDVSRRVMADGLWQQHRVQIEGYVSAHKHNVLEQLAVGSVDVVAAHSDERYDTITVRVRAACADYDVDDQSGKVVRGNKDVKQWREDWTFQRSSTTVTPEGGGTLSARCPNCGAPLDLDLAGVCHYCKAPVMSGQYDWVLSRIAQT